MSQLGELEDNRSDFEDRDAQIIAIAVQTQTEAAASVEASKAQYPILADHDHAVAALYGVYDSPPEVEGGNATPAVFIINPDGEIIWKYIGNDISDRPSSQLILENVP
jgi:peroxiredoxin